MPHNASIVLLHPENLVKLQSINLHQYKCDFTSTLTQKVAPPWTLNATSPRARNAIPEQTNHNMTIKHQPQWSKRDKPVNKSGMKHCMTSCSPFVAVFFFGGWLWNVFRNGLASLSPLAAIVAAWLQEIVVCYCNLSRHCPFTGG